MREIEQVLISVTISQPPRASYLMPSLQQTTVSDAMPADIAGVLAWKEA